jgi:P2-related tail formation protein
MTNEKGKRDYISTSKVKGDKASTKKYVSPIGGKVTYTTTSNSNRAEPDFKKSVDTTGYAAGKKEFTVNSITRKPGQLITVKSAKINRSQVNPTLDKMKKAASKMKTGGTVKSKKK